MSLPAPGPSPAVDAIIELPGNRIVLVRRRYEPIGWALPGGFVDMGEPLEKACAREAMEATGLKVELLEQFFTYSDPSRDKRRHTISTVYLTRADGEPTGADDAAEAKAFRLDELPSPIVFDHAQIIEDFRRYRTTGQRRKLG